MYLEGGRGGARPSRRHHPYSSHSQGSSRRQHHQPPRRGRAQGEGGRRKQRPGKSGPTDSDLERTYTGLDRELAEEFIEQTMDPERVATRQGARSPQPQQQHQGNVAMSGTESEAW